MSARGDKKHQMAAWFGVNQARIREAEQGKHGVEAASADKLPPNGPPGPKAIRIRSAVEAAVGKLEAGDAEAAIKALRKAMEKFDATEV
jgi:hypothetical protein